MYLAGVHRSSTLVKIAKKRRLCSWGGIALWTHAIWQKGFNLSPGPQLVGFLEEFHDLFEGVYRQHQCVRVRMQVCEGHLTLTFQRRAETRLA